VVHADVFQTETTLELVSPATAPRLRAITLNKGPTALYELNLRLEGLGQTSTTLIRPKLGLNETNRVTFGLNVGTRSGTFPLVVWTEFRDKDRIPVSMCDVTLFSNVSKPDSDLIIRSEDVLIRTRSRLLYGVLNNGKERKRVMIRLLAPGVLGVENTIRQIDSEPGSMMSIEFNLMNRYAAPGDVEHIFFIAEYERGPLHYCTVAKNVVTISGKGKHLSGMGHVIGVLVVCSGLIWMGMVIYERKKTCTGDL